MMKEVYCSVCGKKSKSDGIKCEFCSSTLKTDLVETGKKINSFEELVTEENLEILKKTKFTSQAYKAILEEIIRMGYDNFQYDENASVLDNVYQLAEQYTHVYSKHKGGELGVYSSNEIYYDERMPEAHKISTLIHELTHHLYSEIYEQWLMYTFKVEKSIYLEAFALFTLQHPIFKTFNEYIAHTTQARFEEPGCQGYGSFIKLREMYDLDLNRVKEQFAFGRSVSDDITKIIEYNINDDVRKKIIEQFDMDNIPKINEIHFEDLPRMSEKDKLMNMQGILINAMESALKNEESMKFLKIMDKYFV